MGKITILGLGPGDFGLLTLETWDKLQSGQPLFLRTARHPVVAELDKRDIYYTTYDHEYETGQSFDAVYQAIANDVVRRADAGDPVLYAVPGSPLVAEKTVSLIRTMAADRGITVTILPAMSFLETLYARLAIDPIAGVTVVDAADIDRLPRELSTALVVTQIYSRQVASDTKLALMELFPDDFKVTFVRNLSLHDEDIRTIQLLELDRQPVIDHLVCLFVPVQPEQSRTFSLDPLTTVMARLRSPEGCLWDVEQTHVSLRRYMVEEVYEVLEAIDNKDEHGLCEELGDLLLQIVFHARIAEEAGLFSMQDVIDEVTAKLIRRHPHVFGDVTVRDAAEVVVNWETIKKSEKGHRRSVLDGVSPGLPSLLRACKLQAKAAKVGFDWDDVAPAWDKVQEEWQELKQAVASDSAEAVTGELGDLLFAVVNLARFLHIEPETALNQTNNKFVNRFLHVEERVRQRGGDWAAFSLEELDEFWREAKVLEKTL